MKCFNCNTTLPEGTEICPKCGQSLMVSQDLIDRAKSNDQDAIADLYNRTYDSVYSTLKFILKDDDAALDVLQDSYIKAFRSLDQLQEASKFPAWIKRIAHNRAIDELRKAKPVNFSDMVPEDSDEVLEFEDDRPESMPDVVIDRRETARLLGEILDSLPDDQRICVTMFYYDQLSVKEIASELGLAEATVKSRLNYGRKKIESKVRDLEKKGTKLYGFAPIPFLLLLLRQEVEISEASASGVLGSVLEVLSGDAGAAGGAAAGAAAEISGKPAAAGAASAAGKGAAVAAGAAKLTLGTKIIAAVLAVAVIGGGGAAITHGMRKAPEAPPEPPAVVEPAEPEAPAEPETTEEAEAQPDPSVAYESVLDKYSALFDMNWDEFFDKYYNMGESKDEDGINYDLVAEYFRTSYDVFYANYDYNGDGVEELVIALGNDDGKQVNALYTFAGNEAYELYDEQHLGYRINLNVLPDGTFMIFGGGGIKTWSDTICRISDDKTGLDIIAKYVYDEMTTGSTDYVSDTETLTSKEFDEKYGSKAVDATEVSGIRFSLLHERFGAGGLADDGRGEDEIAEDAMIEAFEEVRAGYEACMSGNATKDSPYLKYPAVQWSIEYGVPVKYALYDINEDGTLEMLMGHEDEGGYTPFEIYAFDGTDTAPLTPGFVRDFTYINICKDNTIRTHIGNGGDPREDIYELPANGAELVHSGSINIYETEFVGDVEGIVYNSILTSVANAEISPDESGSNQQGYSEEDFINSVKSYLGVPMDLDVTYEIGDLEYWEAGGQFYEYCAFYHNGDLVAAASVNPVTGEPIKDILMYS